MGKMNRKSIENTIILYHSSQKLVYSMKQTLYSKMSFSFQLLEIEFVMYEKDAL